MSAPASRRYILIVEDDRGLAALMQKHLTRAGHDAGIATTASEAADSLRHRSADLVVLDYGLPDMTGLELIARLESEQRTVPFVVVTGRGDQQVAVDMMKHGAHDYLVKDAGFLELLPSVIGHALEQVDRDRRLDEAEQTIRRQHDSLQTVVDSLSHPLYVIDTADFHVVMANRPARQPTDAGSGQPAPGLRGLDELHGLVEEVIHCRRPVVVEHVAYDTLDEARIFENHGSPIFDDAGQVRQVIQYSLDITERKRAEQALRESEARLRQVVESLPIVLISRDALDGRILLMSGAVEAMLGRTIDEFLTDPLLMTHLIDPEDLPLFEAAMAEVPSRSEGVEIDFRVRHGRSGETVWLQAYMVPIVDEGQDVIRIDAVLVDISAEKRAGAEREQLEMRLQRAQKLESLGVLAGGIAHDFNNLLTVINGNVQFIQETASLNPAQGKALMDIATAARNAMDMTRSLQAFSRPTKPEIRPIDLNDLVEGVYRFLRRLIPARIDFRFQPSSEPCIVAADPGQLQQVLINLCVNSRDAIADRGVLEISTRRVRSGDMPVRIRREARHPDYVLLRIADNGCGMDSETLRRAFDPFFSTKAKDQGTGLGLAIVYRIVEAHDGIVDVQSAPSRGTTPSIYFPLTHESPGTATPTHPLARGDEHVLVIDDEAMIASLLKTLLESSGYRVTVAHRPDEAIDWAREAGSPPQLAIVDYALPEMTGTDCVGRLREIWPDLKCLLITGYELNPADLPRGGQKILRKPFTAASIIQTVREILDEAPAGSA